MRIGELQIIDQREEDLSRERSLKILDAILKTMRSLTDEEFEAAERELEEVRRSRPSAIDDFFDESF